MEKIGEGSYGSVFRVVRKADEQVYAMKRINLKKMDKETKKNTLNEVRILCSINHPSIIAYKESFLNIARKELCIIMEMAEGGDLA